MEGDATLPTKFNLATNNNALLTVSCLIGRLGQPVTHHVMEEDNYVSDEQLHQHNSVEWAVDLQVMSNNATTNLAL